jgi:hypothetical protein
MSDDRIVFEMELDAQADPIAGLLRHEEREFPFVGWVALAGALERFIADGSAENNGKDQTK